MKHKILILGSGFIGERLHQFLQCQISTKLIYTFGDAESEVKRHKPNIIINCIGQTGKRNVDDCEINKDQTLFANTFLPIILAEVALRNRIKLIHISSGCIYNYDYSKGQPINEEKVPDYFKLFYSRSKIYAESALQVLCQKYNILIARIRVPLDNRPHPKNLLTKLISYKKVIDIPNSVTYIPDFMSALAHLIRIDAKGIYNIVNKGSLRYPVLLSVYKKHAPDFSFVTIAYNKLGLERTNLILSSRKLSKSGFKVRPINSILEECVKDYLKY